MIEPFNAAAIAASANNVFFDIAPAKAAFTDDRTYRTFFFNEPFTADATAGNA